MNQGFHRRMGTLEEEEVLFRTHQMRSSLHLKIGEQREEIYNRVIQEDENSYNDKEVEELEKSFCHNPHHFLPLPVDHCNMQKQTPPMLWLLLQVC